MFDLNLRREKCSSSACQGEYSVENNYPTHLLKKEDFYYHYSDVLSFDVLYHHNDYSISIPSSCISLYSSWAIPCSSWAIPCSSWAIPCILSVEVGNLTDYLAWQYPWSNSPLHTSQESLVCSLVNLGYSLKNLGYSIMNLGYSQETLGLPLS